MKRTLCFSRRLLLCAVCSLLGACAPAQKMRVLIKMMPAQEEHFKKNVVGPFQEEYNVQVEVITIRNTEALPQVIYQEETKGGLHLVKVPFDMTRTLTSKNLMTALDDILDTKGIEEIKKEYFLMELSKINEKYYYIPRKFETRMLVYVKSQVRDAAEHWKDYESELNAVLKKHNGAGLPRNYALESDPSRWDYFDIFVAGFYWKSKVIFGKKRPRIAHRSKYYPGTAQRLIDRAYQFGADTDDILAMKHSGIVDLLSWEALYVHEGIYNPSMYKEKWSGSDVWRGFGDGDVFLSFMTQIDAFFIHGAGTDSMPGYLKNPEDMGVALMPQAVSLELSDGKPARTGTRAITTGGWWWGIPKNSPDPELSLKFARYITNTKNQIEGCSSFGMIPVRQDILSELGLMFGGGWISDVFHVASQQLVENQFTIIPLVPQYGQISNNLMDAYFDISVNGNFGKDGVIEYNAIKRRLITHYIPIQKNILGSQYPDQRRSSSEKSAASRQKFQGLNKQLE